MSETEEDKDSQDIQETSGGKKRRMNYTLNFKKEVLKFAQKTNNSKASERFGVPRQCIQKWKMIRFNLEEEIDVNLGAKRRRLTGAGRKMKDAEMDESLAQWVREKRNEKHRVTRKRIQMYASTFTGNSDFKASNGWLHKFMKRHGFVSRRPTTVCQKPPEEYAQKIVDFLLYVENMRQKNNYDHVYACDETAVFLDCSSSLTIDEKGASQVTVKSTGHEKLHVTVMLCARNDGFKCRPFVLLPNKRPIQSIIQKFRNQLVLSWCGKTFFNDEITQEFLKKVLGTSLFGKRLLVWDSFRCHISEGTKKNLRTIKLDTAVIPGGTTKFLQAPDVYWNSVFKAKIRGFYEDWMMHGLKTYTKSGNMRSPPMDVYLQWITDAWHDIPLDLIKKSFIGCGLSNAPGGVDDDQIHCLKNDCQIIGGLELLKKTRQERSIQEIEELIVNVDIDSYPEEEEDEKGDNQEIEYDSDASIDFEN